MGWGDVQRLVEHIFPIAGKFLPGDQSRLHRPRQPAACGHDHLIAHAETGRVPKFQPRHAEFAQGEHQPEACRLIIGQRVARHGAAVM